MAAAPSHFLIDQFLAETGWSSANITNATNVLNRWHRWLTDTHDGAVELTGATIADTTGYLAGLEQAGLKPSTVQIHWRMLRALYGWLEQEELLERTARTAAGPANPMHNVARPRVPWNPRNAAASRDDYETLLAYWPRNTETGTRNAAMLSLMYRTGLRVNEVASVDLDDYDHAAGALTINKTKTDSTRRVPIHSETATLIRRYLRYRGTETGPLFRATGRTASPVRRLRVQAIRDAIKRGCANTDIKLSPQMLRRAFAGNYLDAGGNTPLLKAIAGWTTDAMPNRYMGQRAEEIAAGEFRRIMDDGDQLATRRRRPKKAS